MRTNMLLAGAILAVLSGCLLGKQEPPSAGPQQCFNNYNIPVPCVPDQRSPEALAEGDGTCAVYCGGVNPNHDACSLCHLNQGLRGQIDQKQSAQSNAADPPPPPPSKGGGTSDPPPLQGGDRGGQRPPQQQPAPTILPALFGTIQYDGDRLRAFTYLPPRYERSHRFSVAGIDGADAIVCMFRDGTLLDMRSPDAYILPTGQMIGSPGDIVPLTHLVIVGEYSYLSGKPKGCTRASSTLFDPTGRDGEIATFVLFKPVVGQGISTGNPNVLVAPVWQAVSRVNYSYSDPVNLHIFTGGQMQDLRRSL